MIILVGCGGVAPLAGAWIETVYYYDKEEKARLSRPSRARGLKRRADSGRATTFRVAPLAGAWIETPHDNIRPFRRSSRPSRARGLKHQSIRVSALSFAVAPLAGAWIETSIHNERMEFPRRSRPSRARGLKPATRAGV